ncbi:MAG: response regulator [Candidatus Velamenicoccus archaeovorus]
MRILLADEQALFREAVRVVLESEGDLEVVASVRDGGQAVAEAERMLPDVALIDAGLKNEGIRATRLIRQRVPQCEVVILSSREEADVLEQALEAGARGYVSKTSPVDELLEVTRAVHLGETLVPQRMLGDLLGRLLQRRREQSEALRRISLLTRREREVLGLLVKGAGTEAIARALVISPQTARTHIQNILAKLGVHSRLEAAAIANEADVLDGHGGDGHVRLDGIHALAH